jgi:hypothetical protein
MNNMNIGLLSIACIVGFVGDGLLQFGSRLNMGGSNSWGLKGYFKLHGSAESTFIAGGMMSIFYVIYYLSQTPISYTNLAIYGILLDFIFRKTMLFASLKEYYQHLNYFWSAVWGAIPMIIPLFIFNLLA